MDPRRIEVEVAMTREIATLGKGVAAGLAERLGLTVAHHEIVVRNRTLNKEEAPASEPGGRGEPRPLLWDGVGTHIPR